MSKFILAAAAAASMVATPVLAASTSADALSVQRSGAATSEVSELSAPGSTIGLILFAAIIAGGIYLAVDGDNDSPPVSP
ncbi:hypothetical protein [Novosphingopyxis iocasae]|uniref:hypothetical protein n=1 Tax=Novosphingopyxis iocasae TaxID=2762729 RepID=UPI001651332A|nr:hypothetical protein [Novosphingopyxis iocasae]